MIDVRDLSKSFGAKSAVDGVSFHVKQGEVLGFLGPNGAGKSTTMRIIAGFLPPSSGKITVGGFDVQTHGIEVKRLIGYLPENAPSYSDMSVTGFLNFAAEIRGLRGKQKSRSVESAIGNCFLDAVRNQTIETLSKGYRHRVCLAQAIIHDPPVLILDEPTDGLDPNQKHEVRSLIKKMGDTKAIIFSTHILEEVEAACTRAIIINHGRIVASGTPEELKARSKDAGLLTLKLIEGNSEVVKQKLLTLGGLEAVDIESSQPPVFRIRPGQGSSASTARSIAGMAAQERWALTELSTTEGRLDDVFREITAQDLEGVKK